MKTFKLTYKASANFAGLPREVHADGYRTNGRFFDFYETLDEPIKETLGPGMSRTQTTKTTHKISAEGVVHIETVDDSK